MRTKGYEPLFWGASGFVGRWVARALSIQGAEIFLIDQDRFRAEEICSKYAISGEIVEVNGNNAILEIFKKIKPSITFNLAGYGIIRSERDEKTAYAVNVHLVKVVAESIAGVRDSAWPGQDIVHVGTAMKYGDIDGNLSEDSIPNPTTLYGKSKLARTVAMVNYCETYNLKGLTVRLFMIYGHGEHKGKLLSSLLETAKTGKPLQLTSGIQERDFTYVEDVAEGLTIRISLT